MRPFGVGRITRQRSWIRDHVKIKEILERSEWTSLTTAVVLNTGEAAHLSANNTWAHLESKAFRLRGSLRNHEKIKEILHRIDWTSLTIAVVLNTGEAAHLSAYNRWGQFAYSASKLNQESFEMKGDSWAERLNVIDYCGWAGLNTGEKEPMWPMREQARSN